MSSEIVTIETVIQAPIETVWNAFTFPEHITQWNAASDDWHTPAAENDLRVGGTFKNRMEAKDGSMGFDFEGEYTVVETHKRIEYRMADGREVKVRFEEEGGKVRLTETFEAENQHPVEMQRTGWQSILDTFKKHVESLPLD